MVDFNKLPQRRKGEESDDPREIFRALPHPQGVNDLYDSQGEVLRTWSTQRNKQDLVLKLPTGGGKTLVGLLIARASINELRRPALILAPTRQLVEQIVADGEKHNIEAEAYLGGKGLPLPSRFLSGQAVGVATYSALFNGYSKFGTTHSSKRPIDLGAIILDDAHTSFDVVRDCFSMIVSSKDDQSDTYDELCSIFRAAFKAIGRHATFDDVIAGSDPTVLEIPHWDWIEKIDQVSNLLQPLDDIAWPILKDELRYCHGLISRSGFTVTPILPPVHEIPSFATCKRRVYMSATIADDSEIIRTFGATKDCVLSPIAPVTLAGVAERMILVPGWMDLTGGLAAADLVSTAVTYAQDRNLNTLILTPSFEAAKRWKGATVATKSAIAEAIIAKMQRNEKVGVVVLANRYDGIDLPGDTCRVLVLDGLPAGLSDYDGFRANALAGSVINSTLAQRVEQGIGRAARGSGDYCVVILSGTELVSWLGQVHHMDYLTAATRRQIEIGRTVSSDIHSKSVFVETIEQCINRDRPWIQYHAKELADAAEPATPNLERIAVAEAEYQAVDLMRMGQEQKAAKILQAASDKAPDSSVAGWLLQLKSRALLLAGDPKESQAVQAAAFAKNRRLTRPIATQAYRPAPAPDEQAMAIARKMRGFAEPRACLAAFDAETAALTPTTSANQFEESLKALGEFLGFTSERPKNDFGDPPDVLWRTHDNIDFVIEAKSRKKNAKKPLKKEEHGQLLVSGEWFKGIYPDREPILVSIHPNNLATHNANATDTKALTLAALNQLVSDFRAFLRDVCETDSKELERACAQGLERRKLTSRKIFERLTNFVVAPED